MSIMKCLVENWDEKEIKKDTKNYKELLNHQFCRNFLIL